MAAALIVAWYPRSGHNWKDESAEAAMAHVIEINRTIRNLRSEKKVEAGARLPVIVRAGEFADALRQTAAATGFTSRVELTVMGPNDELPAGEYAFARVVDTEVALALPKVDSGAERTRLEKELGEAEAHAGRLEKQLGNETFRSKAPAHIIAGMEQTLAEAKTRAAGLKERLGTL